MERRVEEQTASGRTLLREYDAAGKLVRITILPLRPDAKKKPSIFSRSKAPATAASAEMPEAAPPAPETAAEIAPAPPSAPAAPPPPPVHVRFPHDAPRAGIDVVVERYEDPEPPRARVAPLPPPRVETPVPTLLEYTDPEPLPEPSATPPQEEPIVPPVRAEATLPPDEPEASPQLDELEPPAPAPLRVARFEIVAIEEVAPPRAPEPEPTPEPEIAREPEPVIAAPPEAAPAEPEPLDLPPLDAPPATVEPPAVEAAPEPALEPVESHAPDPERAPRSYVALVPDVDARVDALLARADAPAKRRKRAPIPAPAFPPLQREPWEERLDTALAGR